MLDFLNENPENEEVALCFSRWMRRLARSCWTGLRYLVYGAKVTNWIEWLQKDTYSFNPRIAVTGLCAAVALILAAKLGKNC